MKIFEYLKPDNPIAAGIVYVLGGMFVFWLGLLLWNLGKNLFYRRQIKKCRDVSALLGQRLTRPGDPGDVPLSLNLPEEGEAVFSAFREAKKLKKHNPIAEHLRAIFEAGWNESQLDVRGLIKNTTDKVFRTNSLLRPLLSLFIILGLLGTLFGLADTMASLDTLLHGSVQLTNDTLGQGLQKLLGTLKGAFAPSILGVSLTVLGVICFALYLRLVALPLGNLLEQLTLTVWVPQLVPTASQKLMQKLQLSRQQMERSVVAAQQVTEFAEDFQQKTSSLNQTLDFANESLKEMARVADGLGTFSQKFIEGVNALTPFQDDLRTLYEQMRKESRAFQESVQRNIAGSEDFQQRIQEQLNSQHRQMTQVLTALQSYEAAYVANRGRIDEKLSAVLVQAELAFQNLSQRNEELGRAIDEALGKPLRQDLTQHLSAVEAALQGQLGEVKDTLQVQLSSLAERLRQLDAPLNKAADNFNDTFSNFNEHTDEWRTNLQREFAKQNETNQKQLQRLESLSEQIPALLEQLTASSNNFSQSSSTFSERGQKLSQDVDTLAKNIAALGQSVDALTQRVVPQPSGGDGDRTAKVLAQQTNILQELAKRMESLASAKSHRPPPAVFVGPERVQEREPPAPHKPRWRDRIRSWIPFLGGR